MVRPRTHVSNVLPSAMKVIELGAELYILDFLSTTVHPTKLLEWSSKSLDSD